MESDAADSRTKGMPMPPTPPRPPHQRKRPPNQALYAALVALAAVLLLAGLASCGGQTSQKTSHGNPAPATTPSAPAPPASDTPTSAPSTEPGGGGMSTSEPGAGSGGESDLDPRFATCAKANAAGYGPYYKGADPEYAWYKDRDHDGIDCEPLNTAAPTSPEPSGEGGLDPRFPTCAKANAAGYGPYVEGSDPEYAWYEDRDHDGIDCEPRSGGEPSSPAPATSAPSEEPSGEPSEGPSTSGPGEMPGSSSGP